MTRWYLEVISGYFLHLKAEEGVASSFLDITEQSVRSEMATSQTTIMVLYSQVLWQREVGWTGNLQIPKGNVRGLVSDECGEDSG